MRRSTIAITLLALALPAIAYAHAGNNDPNMIHACIGNVTKIVRVVGVNGSCLAAPPLVGETAAHWAIQGAPGAPGMNGTNGVNGVDGLNGTNGTNGMDGSSAAHANPPCFDNANRYVDCGNGTVTDTVTGLIWLKDAGCLGTTDWAMGNGAAASLASGQCGLSDGSSPGDWRLATNVEWSATTARALVLGCVASGPALTNDLGTGCLNVGAGTSFTSVDATIYWTSTALELFPISARVVFLNSLTGDVAKFTTARAWPVRRVR